ncbi:MAG: hypothetical protein JWM00_72 [Candidatus Saccharibacteria bacterium]|nr:hypothetical protein [Candidatus Saccharibacteria bacterium]
MADASSARQQIIDKIKDSSNILVTVSQDPSVDELSAALGLTIMLNKLKKHATAVVSGDIPPAVTFLDPEKTFENTVDSLRDFIIALDKEKADHLRYKVDGDVVKIFITPYRTTITDKDLDFSQGDYNVELVLALGVKDATHLDKALEAHGKILHDATVVTMSVSGEPSNLGSIDWHDETASSLSEMLVSLSEAIKGDKPLLDEQISTALLTGIVAATDRFSNDRTSSKVMTMSAQLMAAGANQQLIAAKLGEAHEIGSEPDEKNDTNADGTTTLSEDEATKLDKSSSAKKDETKDKASDSSVGVLAVSHEKKGDIDAVAEQVATENTAAAAKQAETVLGVPQNPEDQLAEELKATVPSAVEPIMGSALNATTEQAADDKRREEADDRNKTILNHSESGHAGNMSTPTVSSPFNANSQPDDEEPPVVDPLANDVAATPLSTTLSPPEEDHSGDYIAEPVPAPQTLAEIDAQARHPHEDARAAVHAAFSDTSTQPSATAFDTTGLPPLPDFSTLPPPPPPLPDPFASTSPQPTGALPPEKLADIFGAPPASAPETPATPSANDPGQFKIPGQS